MNRARKKRFQQGAQQGSRELLESMQGLARQVQDLPASEAARVLSENLDRKHSLGRMAPGTSKSHAKPSNGIKKTGKGTLRANRELEKAANKVDLYDRFIRLRAKLVPGGVIYDRCKNRTGKRHLRAVVNNADKFAYSGEYAKAVEILREG